MVLPGGSNNYDILGGCPGSQIILCFWGHFSKWIFAEGRSTRSLWCLETNPRTHLEAQGSFGDEGIFQECRKSWKSTSSMPCKTKSHQSSRESVCMVHAMPLDTHRPPKYQPELSKKQFLWKKRFSSFLALGHKIDTAISTSEKLGGHSGWPWCNKCKN